MPLEMVRKEPETKGPNTSPQVHVRINSFSVQDSMSWVALRMLTGDRAKYMGLIFTIAFSSFLIAQQVSIFAGIMNRTRSQIIDVNDADMWVTTNLIALYRALGGGWSISPNAAVGIAVKPAAANSNPN